MMHGVVLTLDSMLKSTASGSSFKPTSSPRSRKEQHNSMPTSTSKTMSVVNVKVAHIRPKHANLKEWTEDPQNVYIGRQGIVFVNKVRFPPCASKWHNPYKVSANGYTREEALDLYRAHLLNMLKNEETMKEFLELKGKTLGCWCKPDACHGDIIVELLNTM